MAEVQLSEPLYLTAFTDRGWRAAFAGRTGVIGDADGSSFGLTLPAEGATAQLGSATQPSRLVVDGYGLEVGQGTTQSLDIPASSGGGTNGRTDLVVARLNLSSFTTAPGPVRLVRIAGTEGSLTVPAATYDLDGIRDLPLYAVRRRQGESLNQAIVTDMRPRLAYNYDVPVNAPLPASAPLGSRASRGDVIYRRDSVGSAVDWVIESQPREVRTGTAVVSSGGEGFPRMADSYLVRSGTTRHFYYVLHKSLPTRNPNPAEDGEQWVGTLWDGDKPMGGKQLPLTGWAYDTTGTRRAAAGFIAANGQIFWSWASTNNQFGSSTDTQQTLILAGTWEVA